MHRSSRGVSFAHAPRLEETGRLEWNGLVRQTLTDRDRRSCGLVLMKDAERLHREHKQADHELAVQVLESMAEAGDKQHAIEPLGRIVERLGQS